MIHDMHKEHYVHQNKDNATISIDALILLLVFLAGVSVGSLLRGKR